MNLPELIASLKTGGDEVFSTRKKLLIADALEALAAALAVKDEALIIAQAQVTCLGGSPDQNDPFCDKIQLGVRQQITDALATKPHAALVNKIKADAVRELEKVDACLIRGLRPADILEIADRIEKEGAW